MPVLGRRIRASRWNENEIAGIAQWTVPERRSAASDKGTAFRRARVGLSCRSGPRRTSNIDGTNLYRQKLQYHSDAKRLDREALSSKLLPTDDIQRIRYFTALIQPLLGTDPQAPIRQQTYIRALQTNPKVTVHQGQFRHDRRLLPAMPITFDENGDVIRVRVRKTEENGSDVNLASYMIFDASREEADVFVLLSNDSDFAAVNMESVPW